MRTCPPRARISAATDCPAESWEPLDTLMPVPASKAEPFAPSSVENSSPSAGGWVWPQAQAEKDSTHADSHFKFRLGIKATELISVRVARVVPSMCGGGTRISQWPLLRPVRRPPD